jgi:hypothetical protein
MDWHGDFTHMPPVKKIKYLLVLVDTFTGWVEAFSTTNKRASTVITIQSQILSHGFASQPPCNQTMGLSFFPLFPKNWHKP